MRTKYTVTLTLDDGRVAQFTLWAESPEHAIKKAKSRLSNDSIVADATAEQV